MPTHVDTATKITADSESPTAVSYKWSIVTVSLSCTVFQLFAIFVIMGFLILGPKIGGVLPLNPPKWSSVDKCLLGKRYFLAREHVFLNTRRGGSA